MVAFLMHEMSFMKPITNCFLRTGAALCVACGFATLASAQNLTLRIVCYNIEADIDNVVRAPAGFDLPCQRQHSDDQWRRARRHWRGNPRRRLGAAH